MPEPERLRRIGELIAVAVIRYYRDQRLQQVAQRGTKCVSPETTDPANPASDDTEKQMLRYLARVGAATPRDFQIALGVSPMTITRRLARLRGAGVLSVSGTKRAARYQLAGDSGAN